MLLGAYMVEHGRSTAACIMPGLGGVRWHDGCPTPLSVPPYGQRIGTMLLASADCLHLPELPAVPDNPLPFTYSEARV
jgi:hypothetical protein